MLALKLAIGFLAVCSIVSGSVGRKKYKFLTYSPQFANSHVNFMGKISDALVDAGHEITMLSPIIDRSIGTPGTKRAKVIEIPQTNHSLFVEEIWQLGQESLWNAVSVREMIPDWGPIFEAHGHNCNATIHELGLLEMLRAEKFDAAYAEAIDFCGFGLFHLLGIKKFAVTQSQAAFDGSYYITQVPSMPSYVPSLYGAMAGDSMSFYERLYNWWMTVLWDYINEAHQIPYLQKVFDQFDGFPSLKELVSNASLVFLNSEPLVDFPRITSHRVVDIGGIVDNGEHKPVNKTWSEILDLRPRTVLLSFGSYAKAYHLPDEYKAAIRETILKFPDVTFIWKYEKPEHRVSEGIPNLIEATWIPQVDILYDSRLTAFVTHGGQGSITEAYAAGVPLLVIPIGYDQLRNAHQVVRNGAGVMLDKSLLGSSDHLESAIRELVDNAARFSANARKLSSLVKDRPFSPKEVSWVSEHDEAVLQTFVRHMEFLAEHGPLRMLNHEGRHLNFFQFYLLDVFTMLVGVIFLAVCLAFVFIRTVLGVFLRTVQQKEKSE